MSAAAEIADNKWELQSTKPPLLTAGGLFQVFLIGGLGVFFVWVIVASVHAALTAKPSDADGGLGGEFKNMKAADQAAGKASAPAAAPAATPPAAEAPAAAPPAAEAPAAAPPAAAPAAAPATPEKPAQ